MARSTNSAHVRLHLLGAFRLERDHKPIALSTRKGQSLLAYLALHPQEHAREKVAALLWGDSTDVAARRSLRVSLSNLRAQLGADAILSDATTLQLNPDFPIWIDANEMKDEFKRMRDETEFKDASSFILRFFESHQTSSFDLLPDFYDEWILQEREQLRAKFIASALQFVQHARGASEYEDAIEAAQKILQVDRANETAHQHLMFCYVVTGKRNTALEQYAVCERALREELAVEPSDETRALELWIRQASGTRSLAGQITNLPIPPTTFIGRRRQVQEVKDILRAGHSRLLTLLGAGGSGKTRLAIQVGTELIGHYADGVWWVELAPLNDAALVLRSTARALGVNETRGESLRETLLEFLRDKALLLILDNCEHLIEACAQLVNEILVHCPKVLLLVTSRQVVNVYGETVWNVPTLDVPQTETFSLAALLMEYEGARLFVERARAANAQFALTEQNALVVAQICRRLDGIPLALELAAARVRTLTAEQIAARLDTRFDLLTGGARTALPRQQTLRALMDWSYDLLTADEKQFFARLAVFAGGWNLRAAERVTFTQDAAMDVLIKLVDKSLVVADTRGAETRFTMLETIREYAHAAARSRRGRARARRTS